MKFSTALSAILALGLATPGISQTRDVEEAASEEEMAKARDAIGAFGCEADEVEKESDALYEIDDANCGEAGQYDIRLDGDFTVTVMTYDGPIDEDGEEVEASEEEAKMVEEALEAIECEADEIEKEAEGMFEIDDASCEMGQFDIKLNSEGTIMSMIYDGPLEEGGVEGGGPSEKQVAAIVEVLAGMNCEMDPDDIEVEDDGYELDDVFCEDGQYDITLDSEMQVTSRKKE